MVDCRNQASEDRVMERRDLQTEEYSLHIWSEVLNMKCPGKWSIGDKKQGWRYGGSHSLNIGNFLETTPLNNFTPFA